MSIKLDDNLKCTFCGKQGAYLFPDDNCCSMCWITVFGGERAFKMPLVVEKPMVVGRMKIPCQ